MKKFNVYVKISGKTRMFEVQHYSHEEAIQMVSEAVNQKPHGEILSVDAK